ncbi:hypothetical protein SKAU_G00385710 [Synaphobranchus kaupii]|uniref:Uncharacterized protein n=1 Tax=Synaphobranchus kaupii TaxID=118154 RepID=A0A9Q1IF82_SYNKA|nr:hypothetical protein SKAU_G00385710 [Synaphobranchus kaupii]
MPERGSVINKFSVYLSHAISELPETKASQISRPQCLGGRARSLYTDPGTSPLLAFQRPLRFTAYPTATRTADLTTRVLTAHEGALGVGV